MSLPPIPVKVVGLPLYVHQYADPLMRLSKALPVPLVRHEALTSKFSTLAGKV